MKPVPRRKNAAAVVKTANPPPVLDSRPLAPRCDSPHAALTLPRGGSLFFAFHSTPQETAANANT